MENYSPMKRDFAVVNLYFGNPTTIGRTVFFSKQKNKIIQAMVGFMCLEYERRLSMTKVDFLSLIGGCFGLCLGFSLVSALEFLYWFGLRVGRIK